MSTEGKYVAAAYLVVFVVLLGYVLIIALKLQRLQQEMAELVGEIEGEEEGKGRATSKRTRTRGDEP